MRNVAIMVHGMWVRDKGVSSIGKLRPYLMVTHDTVKNFGYPFLGLMGTRNKNDNYAQKLVRYLHDLELQGGDSVTLYCHSNGCTIAHLATQDPSLFILAQRNININVVFINAALNRKVKFSKCLSKIRVFYSVDDKVVVLAHWYRKFLERFGLESRWRPWGDMGRRGYAGERDNRVRSSSHRGALKGSKGKIGHMGCFNISACKQAIAQSVRN
jgi:hypothetical protein